MFIRRTFWAIILLILTTGVLFSQKRTVEAVRSSEKIVADGILSELIWQTAPVFSVFYTYQPTNGDKSEFNTFVQVTYNDYALYVAAFMQDTRPDSIYRELTVRDDINGNTDLFALQLNPNCDGQNAYEFYVTAANVQSDARVSTFNNDYSWDAVWRSGVSTDEKGWYAEFEIPWSAIRFPKAEVQEWDVNFFRSVRRVRQTSCYNPVDRNYGSKTEQMAGLTGISNIDSPLRLSFNPYISGYMNHYSEFSKPAWAFNGGLDMKLGLSESYTLDMTLIPDFGQEKSDDIILNLSPFETYYEEHRPFFTEGTELFEKCDLFYSRRIGKQPDGYYSIDTLTEDGYTIIKNPAQSRLLNAFKITGRDKNNLAIGVFNAFTGNTYAIAENTEGVREKFRTEPWANYNLLVIDKAFNKKSYLNITNALAIRPDKHFISNVTGTAFKVMDKFNRFGVIGNAAISHVNTGLSGNKSTGERASLQFGKLTGKWQYSYMADFLSDEYNPNVMGYLQENNKFSQDLSLACNFYEPVGRLNALYNEVYLNYSTLVEPFNFTSAHIHFWNYAQTRKHLSIWNDLHIPLSPTYDYYEPRVPGRFYRRAPQFYDRLYLSTDYRKRLAIDVILQGNINTTIMRRLVVSLEPRVRISNQVILVLGSQIDETVGQYGYLTSQGENIYFGLRDVSVLTNTVSLSWVFTNTMNLQLNGRHYWSRVDYSRYYLLNENGTLAPVEIAFTDKNISFNAFSVDLVFSWNFAPGSFLNIAYKNNIQHMELLRENNIFPGFGENFINTMQQPQWNSLSVKLIYYVDWTQLKTKIN